MTGAGRGCRNAQRQVTEVSTAPGSGPGQGERGQCGFWIHHFACVWKVYEQGLGAGTVILVRGHEKWSQKTLRRGGGVKKKPRFCFVAKAPDPPQGLQAQSYLATSLQEWPCHSSNPAWQLVPESFRAAGCGAPLPTTTPLQAAHCLCPCPIQHQQRVVTHWVSRGQLAQPADSQPSIPVPGRPGAWRAGRALWVSSAPGPSEPPQFLSTGSSQAGGG